MIAARRIITVLWPSMFHERAASERVRCRATITLDRKTYRCGRQHVDGVHDAFDRHADGGEVRW